MNSIDSKFLIAGRFLFDSNSNCLYDQQSDEESSRLGSNEGRILLLLCQNPNDVITRQELHEFVWREQGFEVDDSSLTQAISTLRKSLKDSTRSPIYIKTVPKRGYQLICAVETCYIDTPLTLETPLKKASEAPQSNTDKHRTTTPDATDSLLPVEGETSSLFSGAQTNSKPLKQQRSPLSWRMGSMCIAMLTVAILLPIYTAFFSMPPTSELKLLMRYQNTPVYSSLYYPSIEKWKKDIQLCVSHYLTQRQAQALPTQIIVTGGEEDKLVLNYIHKENQASDNFTVRILYDKQAQLAQVCQ
ncbi:MULTISPECIES: transcriptional regulator [unclassified Vibrio]|uniref:Transcriptional regulator n=1 Tax=Vibrio sp. HB236076 TaxID=3232307 RepID=A0AB39HCR5_9VIBR|nr:transcriptional regulator [Vibrio sp. HB161653]MDP5254289.1 transcriptional regulator [Vibrio sp. HB161653]